MKSFIVVIAFIGSASFENTIAFTLPHRHSHSLLPTTTTTKQSPQPKTPSSLSPNHLHHTTTSTTLLSSISTTNNNDDWETKLLNGVSKMNTLMSPNYLPSSTTTSLQILHSQCTKMIEVKESTIPSAGRGLFATKNIRSGTIISFYPVHALGRDNNNDDDGDSSKTNSVFIAGNDEDKDYFSKHPAESSPYLHVTDQTIFDRPSLLSTSSSPDDDDSSTDPPLYLDCNPHRLASTDDPLWVSHIINDGATITSPTDEGIGDYYESSKRARNCVHIPFGPSPIMATVTTRKVKKGEEFFTSYGCTYWLGVLEEGGEGVGVGATGMIQQQIRDSAMVLFKGMGSTKVVYAKESQDLIKVFEGIKV